MENKKSPRSFLCFGCDFKTSHQGERKLHCKSWTHQMREYFALKSISQEEFCMGQSCDYQSSVDTGTFSFKLKISQEDFISKIHQNRVSMLREMNLGFILEKPIGDKEKANEWWAPLSFDQKKSFLQFENTKGPNRAKIVLQKCNSDKLYPEFKR